MIVILNIVLKQVLQVLVRFEKHWSQSDQEKAYAILAFVSQLLNSVLVLLLVNARSSIASNTINSTLSGNQRTSWCVWMPFTAGALCMVARATVCCSYWQDLYTRHIVVMQAAFGALALQACAAAALWLQHFVLVL